MKKIVLTGFGAFGNNLINPTEAVVKTLSQDPQILPFILPVVYDSCSTILDNVDAEIYLHLGLAASRSQLTLEKFAYNTKSAPIPDNAGVICSGEKILPSQPDILQTPFNLEKLINSLEQEGIPSSLSTDPGRYVCNNIYFHSLAKGRKALFVHLPPFEKLPLATAVKAVKIIIKNACLHKSEVQ